MRSEHALDGMVDVKSKTCAHPISTRPPYGMVGSKAEMCLEHALVRWLTWLARGRDVLAATARSSRHTAWLDGGDDVLGARF